MKLGDAKIQRFKQQFGFADWLGTSAKTGENCSDRKNKGKPSTLKQLIAEKIPWDQLPWTSTPRLLTELKNAVIAMRDEHDIRLLRFAELTQRLEQALPDEKFEEADVRTAVTLLANHGLARALKFGDLVLLQPELLNGYAGAIIRGARANKDEIGSVLESEIYDPEFDFTGVARLKHRPDEELLLRALVQTFLDHSLCIAEDLSNGRHLVFPSQYRRDKDIPHDPDIFVSYTFSGEWQTVWSTLVVRLWYSQEFEHKELWRNAAEFASPKGFTLGLKIDNKQGEGTATVSLYFDKEVPDELKVIFIEYVHRHLAKFGCEVSRDRRYVCQECGKPVLDLDAVRTRLEAKKDFIYCQKCDEKVLLIDFIEQRLKTDKVARRILAMEETATRALDTQALEQILIGHMMAICGEANQIFRELTKFDYGVDAEVEFKDNDGNASGKKIYVQLKSRNSYLRTRKTDGSEVFDVKNERHLEYWITQPVDVYLVIRQTDEVTGAQTIRWMNVSSYLRNRRDKKSKQIVFEGEKLDMEAVWKVRDQFFPKLKTRK
jgi:DNA-directed RNA polymerase subunit RPC12/RpoP